MYTKSVVWLIIAFLLFILAVGVTAQPQEAERYKIDWRGYTFYINKPIPTLARSLTLEAYSDTVQGYYFVQFKAAITKDMKAQVVAAGGELFEYVPNNAYIVKMDVETKGKVGALAEVQ